MFRDHLLSKYLFFGLALTAVPLFGANENNFTYLALGESIAFGYNPLLQAANATPDQYRGYPEFVAKKLHLTKSKKEVNAACPGETSLSFLPLIGQS